MIEQISTIVRAIHDNVSYDLDGDVTKCRAFIVAARQYLTLSVEEAEELDFSVRLNMGALERQLGEAMDWYKQNGPTDTRPDVGVTHLDFSEFRNR